MSDTITKAVRLIDNIKVEVYSSGRKKYAKIWDPTDNNTYSEDNTGPSSINSPEKSQSLQSANSDDDVIKGAIDGSRIVKFYLDKNRRSRSDYYKYLQDPFSDTPPTKRVYGGGNFGTSESDVVGPTPYYLNNGCKINIKWIGKTPNPAFTLGTFSTPDEAEEFYSNENPKGPERFLDNQSIYSDFDEVDNSENDTIKPKSEWILETYYNPGNNATPGATYSNYRDKSIVYTKAATLTLPVGFTENEGKGYLDWREEWVYNTTPKKDSKTNYFSDLSTDDDILNTVIDRYKTQVAKLHGISSFSYDLKLCFPDTGTCSLIEYKSPLTLSDTTPSATQSEPELVLKKVKLNILGLPGVTSLSGETDGSIKVKTKVSLPEFTVFIGDPPGATAVGVDGSVGSFGIVEDDVENPDPYEETAFAGKEEAAGEFIATDYEVGIEKAAALEDAKLLGNDNSTSNNGITVNGVPPNTPLPSSSSIPAAFNGVPLYSQYDTRWSSSPYDWAKTKKCGDNSTVASSGCGPSAVSMVINFWASKGYCSPVTPAIVAKFFADFGGRVCGSGSGLGGVPKEKFKEKFGIVLDSNASDATVMKYLKQGYPCVVAGKNYSGYNYKGEKLSGKYSGGHFVCLTGIDSQGRVRVNDSGNNPSNGKAITAFFEGKTPAQSRTTSQTAILYPANMSALV